MNGEINYDSPATQVVRKKVKEMLVNNDGFRQMRPEEQRALANSMVKVANYIVAGEDGKNIPTSVEFADPKSPDSTSGADLPGGRPKPPGETAGEEITGNASKMGGKAFTDTIQQVDFPKFVAGLIDGVFSAIVDSSIKQMEAYAELVKNVSKSVDQYMKDNVSENQSRDYLANRYPDFIEIDINGDQPKARTKQGHDENNMPDFFADLGLSMPLDSFDDDTVEEQLVPAARRRMAMDRQQLLATMVLMGINRVVVTNGFIKSKVNFRLDTNESVSKRFTQTAEQAGGKHSYSSTRPGLWKRIFSDSTYSGDSSYGNFKVSTVDTTDSDSSIKMHADLMGEVNVNFKSDYFPLEKMTDILGVNDLQERYSKTGKKAPEPAQGAK
jgi:hypothetical protein